VAVLKFITNLGRGALMGSAEVVPGVSGGTLALIVGIYQTLINSIADLVLSVRQLVGLAPGKASTKTAVSTFKSLPWRLLIPVAIGMGAAVILGAKLIEPLLDEQPIAMKALFFGLVIAGTYVPAHMVTKVGGWSPSFVLLGLISAVFVFFLTGLPQGNMADPSLIVVFFSALIAICALVLPGVSGSFLLLTVGMYDPTIAAVNDRNFTYLIVFALGAILGLAIFVSLLKWLLENRARVTLVIITGLMLGSLRALWPWQGPERELLAPTDQIGIALLLFIAGAAFVTILLALERKFGVTEEQKDLLEA
jgi:putative membrane protein